ncbi:MAG: fumarylacetoacetate hydrolase family protein [Armatimonadetes bacterium]|nr:fumarylacetoacetate hydrolase family protein [Armatimonadota bacterium]
MKIIRFEDAEGRVGLGRAKDEGMQEAERLEGDLFGPLRPTGETVAVRRLLAPLDPPNLLCIGLNYRQHAEESHMDIPKRPVLFLKATTAVTGPDAPVVLPALSYQVDWEGELAVVIGKVARDVAEADALDHVLGYACANDVSARDWQLQLDKQWARGKSFDGFCPLGPALVTADEVGDPGALPIRTRVNGITMQDSSTSDLIFSVPRLIAYLSQGMTLLPGTVILTGTPSGVGMGRNPPRFLRPGDVCEVEIEGVGTLRTPFVADDAGRAAAA